jgi:hypothetical protein
LTINAASFAQTFRQAIDIGYFWRFPRERQQIQRLRAYIYQQIAEGKLRARKRGRRTVILPADLRAWVESLPEFKPSRCSSNTSG